MKNGDGKKIKLGRPLIYDDPVKLKKACEAYLDSCWTEDNEGEWKQTKYYSISGLCNFIGMTKNSLWDYEQRPDFSDTVKMAKQFIEESWNDGCLASQHPAGHIFMLKSVFKYREGQDINLGGQADNPLKITQTAVSPITPIDMTPDDEE